MRDKILYIWLFLTFGLTAHSQDLIYTQYHLSPSHINPAFTGNTYGAYFTTQLRSQWLKHDFPYNALSLSYSQQYNEASGLGINMTTQQLSDGGLSSNVFSALYSIKVKLQSTTYLKGGVELGYAWNKINWEKFTFYDNLDPRYGAILPGGERLMSEENLSGINRADYIDISLGVTLYNPKYYAGLSIKHANQPNNSFLSSDNDDTGQLPILFSIQAGYQVALRQYGGESILITPNLLIANQSGTWQSIGGAYIDYDLVNFGLWYRHTAYNSDAIIASIGMEYGLYKISYSFDYTVSGLTIGSGGAHEIGVALNFDKIRPKKSRYSDCFEIFR